jgi:hypothetical protein
MPGLTVTEKEHWKNRIARRIDKRIEVLWAEEPNLAEQIAREGHQQALASLGLIELQAELDEIERQEEKHEQRKHDIGKQMLAAIRRVPVDQVREYQAYRHAPEVEAAVARRETVFADQLLAASSLGTRILSLRHEKDNLLDTVWLATSSASIKTLWEKVGQLLGDEATPLERDALTIPPDVDA